MLLKDYRERLTDHRLKLYWRRGYSHLESTLYSNKELLPVIKKLFPLQNSFVCINECLQLVLFLQNKRDCGSRRNDTKLLVFCVIIQISCKIMIWIFSYVWFNVFILCSIHIIITINNKALISDYN